MKLFTLLLVSSGLLALLLARSALASPLPLAAAAPNADQGTLFCSVCESAIAALETNKTDAEILKELTTICNTILPSALAAKCVERIDQFGKVVVSQSEGIVVKYSPYALCSIMEACAFDCCITPVTPEQIHISLAGPQFSDMTVTWTTLQPVANASVFWGLDASRLDSSAPAEAKTMTLGGWRGVVYHATMTSLLPGTRYHYKVGSLTADIFWSHPAVSQPDLTFVTPSPQPFPVRAAIIGDMGADDASDFTVLRIAEGIEDNIYNLTLHDGDLSYADGWNSLEDIYLRKIEIMTAFAPAMSAAGNHEGYYDFVPYKLRYNMPYTESNSTDPLYYSFNYGGIHFINFNTESGYGLTAGDINPNTPQFLWLKNDLIQANKNRDKQPWIVVSGHRPLYCSSGRSDCGELASALRNYVEDLFYAQKVDVVMQAHIHYYECTYPTYKQKKMSGYTDPQAPIYIVNGAAGNKEHLDGIPSPVPDYVDTILSVYGFGALTAHNATHLQWQFISAHNNAVLHDVTLVKSG